MTNIIFCGTLIGNGVGFAILGGPVREKESTISGIWVIL